MERPELKTPLSMMDNASEARSILGRVRHLRAGMKLVLWLELFFVLVLLLLGGAVWGLLFILHFAPRPVSLAVFSSFEILLVSYLFYKFFFSRRRRHLSNLAMSAWIEKAIPGLQDRLITAVEFADGLQLISGDSVAALYDPDYITAFFEETGQLIRRTFLMRVLFRRRFIILLLSILSFFALFENSHYFSAYTAKDLRNIYLDNHRAIWRGLGTPLVVEPGDAKIVRGSDLRISAYSLRPGRKPNLEMFFRAEGQPWESAPMKQASNDEWTFLFRQLVQPLQYIVSDGTTKSDPYQISVVDGPKLSSIRVQLMMPTYTGLGIMILNEGEGNIKTLPQSQAKIVVSFRQEVEKVELLLGEKSDPQEENEPRRFLMVQSSGNWRGQFVVDKPGWYRIAATDPEGFSSGKELTYTIDVVEEATPEIRFIQPEGPIDFLDGNEAFQVRPGQYPKVPIQYEAKDDFGVARVELCFEQSGGVKGHRILEEFDYGQPLIQRDYQWDIEPFWGGSSVSYYLKIFDHLAVREEMENGITQHFGESEKRELFWGKTTQPKTTKAKPPILFKEKKQEESGEGSKEEELTEDINKLAEMIKKILEKQNQVSQKAEQLAGEQKTASTPDEKLSEKQKEVSEEIEKVRRQIRDQADDIRQPKEEPPKPEEEEEPEKAPEITKEATRESTDQGQEGDPAKGKGKPGSTEGSGDGKTQPGSEKREEMAEQMDSLAKSLEKQRIEQTPSGFKTQSGLEGESRLNQQLLQQGQNREAAEKGKNIENELKSIENQLRQMAMKQGGSKNEQSIGKQGGGSISGPGGPGVLEFDPQKKNSNAGMIGDGHGAKDSGSFNDYRPSRFNPPQLRKLGHKSGSLGEYLDFQSNQDPFGDAPQDERYPLKYEGLVETYFEILAETEDDE